MKKVMIIEDNKDIQEIYRHSFEKAGYEVILKDNGLDGLNSVAETIPNVILLDLMMPKMDGFEFLRTLKKTSSTDFPVIVCSNISDSEINQNVLDAGAIGVILKVDYSGKQLVDKVEYLLQEHEKNKAQKVVSSEAFSD